MEAFVVIATPFRTNSAKMAGSHGAFGSRLAYVGSKGVPSDPYKLKIALPYSDFVLEISVLATILSPQCSILLFEVNPLSALVTKSRIIVTNPTKGASVFHLQPLLHRANEILSRTRLKKKRNQKIKTILSMAPVYYL